MIRQIDLDFGTIKVHHNFLVAELKEGILLDVDSNHKLLEIGQAEFQGRPYGYISHRIFSYAVDPFVYVQSADFPSLKAIAVVSPLAIGRKSAEVERNFFKDKGAFEIFANFEEAVTWIESALASTS